MLKAWRAHQAEVRRRAEAGEPPLKTIEEWRAEMADALPGDDAPEPEPDPKGAEPDPKGADSAEESEIPTRVRAFDSFAAQGTGVQGAAGDEEPAAKKIKGGATDVCRMTSVACCHDKLSSAL